MRRYERKSIEIGVVEGDCSFSAKFSRRRENTKLCTDANKNGYDEKL